MSILRKLKRSICRAQGIPLWVTSKKQTAKVRKFVAAEEAKKKAAIAAAEEAVAADPELANLSDEELAARNLASLEAEQPAQPQQ